MISVGVDIGTYSIKVAEVEPTSKSYAIRRVQEFPLSLDLTKDKKIEIIDTLRTLFAQYDLDNTQFIFSLPQKYVSARILHFPFSERFKVQKAVISQLEDDLPFAPEDAVFDAKIVRYIGKTCDVIAMAVPKERVTNVLNEAHDCGVEPALISCDALGLANLFDRWDSPPPQVPTPAQGLELPASRTAEIILNIGHVTTQMLVYSEGLLLGARNIDWGAKNMADAIGQKYGLNYLQGMRELQTKGFILLDRNQGTKEQLAFSQTIEKGAQDLVAALRLKMLEMQSELNLQWARGYITGGGAQLKNFGAFLTQSFEIPFNRYKQFEQHPSLNIEANPHIEMVSAVAVGLAIEGLKRPRNPATNFLKGEFAQQSHFFESLWEKWGYAAQVLAAAFVILLVYGYLRLSASTALLEQSEIVLRRQAETIANLKGKRASPAAVKKFLANQEHDAKNRKLAEKVVHLNSALDILNAINNAIPPKPNVNLEVKRISIDNENAEVQGYADSAADRDRVLQALQKVSSNGRADSIPARIPIPSGKLPFAVRFHIQRYSGG